VKGFMACDEHIAENERVHLRAEKAVQRFFGAADDGLVVVEGCVQDDGEPVWRSNSLISA